MNMPLKQFVIEQYHNLTHSCLFILAVLQNGSKHKKKLKANLYEQNLDA
jgi:hypothetical protein